MIQFAIHHQVVCTLAGYGLFTAIVSGMPSPDEKSSKGYIWAFNSLHILSGMLGRIPQLRAIFGNGNGNTQSAAQAAGK